MWRKLSYATLGSKHRPTILPRLKICFDRCNSTHKLWVKTSAENSTVLPKLYFGRKLYLSDSTNCTTTFYNERQFKILEKGRSRWIEVDRYSDRSTWVELERSKFGVGLKRVAYLVNYVSVEGVNIGIKIQNSSDNQKYGISKIWNVHVCWIIW